MINRRGFFGRLAGAAALGAAGATTVSASTPTRAIEPFPAPFTSLVQSMVWATTERRYFATIASTTSHERWPITWSSDSSGTAEVVDRIGRQVRPVAAEGNERFAVDCDLCETAVSAALPHLGWAPGEGPIALLCVHPSQFALAKKIEAAYCGELAVYAKPFCDDADTWFVAWRGRRFGSIGA